MSGLSAVEGAESGTRLAIVLLGLGWWIAIQRATKRVAAPIPLRFPTIGLVILATFILGTATYGFWRYGVSGASAVVAGAET